MTSRGPFAVSIAGQPSTSAKPAGLWMPAHVAIRMCSVSSTELQTKPRTSTTPTPPSIRTVAPAVPRDHRSSVIKAPGWWINGAVALEQIIMAHWLIE